VPFPGDGPLAQIIALKEFWGISGHPAMDRRMVDRDAALGHHHFQFAQTQSVGQIPTDAEQNHGLIELPAFEHLTASEFHRRSLPDES
jgi:hypothetical protein